MARYLSGIDEVQLDFVAEKIEDFFTYILKK